MSFLTRQNAPKSPIFSRTNVWLLISSSTRRIFWTSNKPCFLNRTNKICRFYTTRSRTILKRRGNKIYKNKPSGKNLKIGGVTSSTFIFEGGRSRREPRRCSGIMSLIRSTRRSSKILEKKSERKQIDRWVSFWPLFWPIIGKEIWTGSLPRERWR